MVNEQGEVIRANDALENILGWTPSEIIGAKIETFLAPELRKAHQKHRQEFYKQPKTHNMNDRLNLTALHKNGYSVPVDIKLSFLEIEGKTYGTAIVRDATRQRELQNSLQEKYEIIKKTMDEKNRLLGIAAHDMRNPIGIIQNFAQILLTESIGSLNEDQKEFVSRIYQSSVFTMGLLEDMLDFSTIESGTMQLSKELFRFDDLLNEVLVANKIYAQEKEISLNINTASIEKTQLCADKRKLNQVLHNLINNAIKYSPTHSQVNINANITDDKLIFSVEDQGVGIPKEDLDNLFQPFYRAKNKPTAGEKATGLGLFITKSIVEAHHGTLHVNSVDGNGSIFSVDFPLKDNDE